MAVNKNKNDESKVGRPSLYTPEIQREICEHIEKGLSEKDAYTYAGVKESTYFKWKREIVQFSQAIKKALIGFKRTHLETIGRASKRSWTAAAWLLERKFPAEFKEQKGVEHSDKLTLDELVKLIPESQRTDNHDNSSSKGMDMEKPRTLY